MHQSVPLCVGSGVKCVLVVRVLDGDLLMPCRLLPPVLHQSATCHTGTLLGMMVVLLFVLAWEHCFPYYQCFGTAFLHSAVVFPVGGSNW